MNHIFLLLLSLLVFSSCTPTTEVVEQTPVKVAAEEVTDFTASFEIITNGTKRVFTQAMYHNQSPDAYIDGSDPNSVRVKKSGTTWDDFFKTLPFSLTKECLITGTKQTFCSSETKQLRFFINDVEVPDALDVEIGAGDHLRVVFGT